MSYKINKTDSTLLVDLIDGRIDTDSTDLVLVGRNYTGYGEYLNENFIKILENFANSASPANPLRGQLWYDTSEGRLKVFNGTNWKGTDTTSVSGTQPTMLAGDIWIDSTNNQMYMSDGSEITLVGPGYTALQGKSGWDVVTLVDRVGQNKVVNRLMIGGNVVAIYSKETFIAATIDVNLALIPGFATTILAGINISTNYSDFEFHGPSASTRSLLDDADNTWTPDDFIKANPTLVATTPQPINHYTHINSDYGLLIGGDSDIVIFPTVVGSDKKNILRNRLEGADFGIQINDSGSLVDALFVDTANKRIGLWNTTPAYTLDLTGDLRITGNLQVDGNTTYLDVSTLRVEDKNIELAVPADSSTLSDVDLDGAGITIVGQNGSKDIVWKNTAEDNGTWQINAAFDIPAGYTYKIGGTTILSTTELADTVTSATGLTEIGTLSELNVDNINLNNKSITVGGGAGLSMTFDESAGNINLVNAGSSPVSITGVATPDVSDVGDWVATTEYVDQIISRQDIYLSLDITGLSNSQIASVIEDMIPAQSKSEGVHAYVHCTQYSGTYAYDAGDGLTKSFVAVDKNGTENQSVLLDISFTEQTGQTVTLSVTRSLKQFIRNGAGQWAFFRELTSSV